MLIKQVEHLSSMNMKDYTKKIDVGDSEYNLVQTCNRYSNNIDRE